MAGTVPVSGSLTLQALADLLNRHEQLGMEQVTNLGIDSTQPRNLLTTIDQPAELTPLVLCGQGNQQDGMKILSATVYVQGKKMDVDLYRLM